MKFVARLPAAVDPQMTLFEMRRAGATADFDRPEGASDLQARGEVKEEKIDTLAAALARHRGALHIGDRHFRLDGSAEEVESAEAAEAHLDGPYTVPGKPRSAWAFGDDVRDHVVQVLYLHGEQMGMRDIVAGTGRRPETVMAAMQKLGSAGVVRKFRTPGDTSPTGEKFGLSRDVRQKIDMSRG